MLVFHAEARFVCPYGYGGHIEWSVEMTDFFEYVTVSCIASKEKSEPWSFDNPTAPQRFVVIGQRTLTPVLRGSEYERY